jgi:hypothetical protein
LQLNFEAIEELNARECPSGDQFDSRFRGFGSSNGEILGADAGA